MFIKIFFDFLANFKIILQTKCSYQVYLFFNLFFLYRVQSTCTSLIGSTVCARDRDPYEVKTGAGKVKNARRETQTHASKWLGP
jgi:hypothetical protein